MEFRKLSLEDKARADKLLELDRRMCSGYTFSCNYVWQYVYNLTFSFDNECYTIRTGENGNYKYTFPVGSNENILKTIKQLIDEYGNELVLISLEKRHKEFLEKNMPGVFEFDFNQDDSDYVYLAENLIELKGKKYQSKRNHIRRFKDDPDWSYEPLTKDNIVDCIDLNLFWSDEKNIDEIKDRRREISSANTALACYFELGFSGGLIRRDGEVVAYTIGEPITDDTYVIHFEKAKDIQGAYAVINNEFVKHNCQVYKYINREEDMGDVGLRKAKMSYAPEFLLDKYYAKVK